MRLGNIDGDCLCLFDGMDFSEPLTRARFEELNNGIFRKTTGPVKKAVQDANLVKHQIDESTRINLLQEGTNQRSISGSPSASRGLSSAIAALKEELIQCRRRNVEPMFEEFIPLKKICKEKKNWMSSVQLLNNTDDQNKQAPELHKEVHEQGGLAVRAILGEGPSTSSSVKVCYCKCTLRWTSFALWREGC